MYEILQTPITITVTAFELMIALFAALFIFAVFISPRIYEWLDRYLGFSHGR